MFSRSKKSQADESLLWLVAVIIIALSFLVVAGFVSSNYTSKVQETADYTFNDQFQPLFLKAFIEYEFEYSGESYQVYDLLRSSSDEDVELLGVAREAFLDSYNIDYNEFDNIYQDYLSYARGDSSSYFKYYREVIRIERGVSELPNFGSLYLYRFEGPGTENEGELPVSYFPILTINDGFTLVYFQLSMGCKEVRNSIEVRCNHK